MSMIFIIFKPSILMIKMPRKLYKVNMSCYSTTFLIKLKEKFVFEQHDLRQLG